MIAKEIACYEMSCKNRENDAYYLMSAKRYVRPYSNVALPEVPITASPALGSLQMCPTRMHRM